MPSTPSGTPDAPKSRSSAVSWLILLVVFAIFWLLETRTRNAEPAAVEYSTLYRWAEDGLIEKATLQGQRVEGVLRLPTRWQEHEIKRFRATLPATEGGLVAILRDAGTNIDVERDEPSLFTEMALRTLPWLVILVGWAWLVRHRGPSWSPGAPLGELTKSKGRRFAAERGPAVRFEDVAGLEGAKRELHEIVEFFKAPERFKRLGARVPRGVLLVGPPGTGKTMFARAVAGESSVPFFSVNASEFVEMFVGLGAARVRDLFAEAKKGLPAIVFIDEIDAVGRARGAGLGMGNDEREQTLNQLLAEMDGFAHDESLVVLAATNRPDVLDPALLRPGRFDRRVVIDRPELSARRAILTVHTKGKPLASDVDLQQVADSTPGFSGADLANLVNEAAISASRRGGDSIAAGDFSAAYDKIVLGDPREGKLGAKERRRVAAHEAGHALVARLLPGTEPLKRVSILPRGLALGATQQLPDEERHLATRSELHAKLAVMLGGFAAEELSFADTSTGAEHDLHSATDLAQEMVTHYGMSERLGPVYYSHHMEHPFLGPRLATDVGTSDATVHAVEEETRRILGQALVAARQVISGHRPMLERLAAELLLRETLEGDDLAAVFRPDAPKGAA